jgi:hypothetical protein
LGPRIIMSEFERDRSGCGVVGMMSSPVEREEDARTDLCFRFLSRLNSRRSRIRTVLTLRQGQRVTWS